MSDRPLRGRITLLPVPAGGTAAPQTPQPKSPPPTQNPHHPGGKFHGMFRHDSLDSGQTSATEDNTYSGLAGTRAATRFGSHAGCSFAPAANGQCMLEHLARLPAWGDYQKDSVILLAKRRAERAGAIERQQRLPSSSSAGTC